MNNEEKSNNNNYFFKTEKSKTTVGRKKLNINNIFTKTYSGNILNNKSNFWNKEKNIFMNNIISPKSIDSYKTKYNFYLKKESDLMSDFKNDSKNKSNILSPNVLSPTNSNNPYIKKTTFIFTRTDSKESNLNISTINRTVTNSNIQLIKINSEEANKNTNKVKYKAFYVENEPNWYFKNKFIKNRMDKNMIKSPLFQKKIIDDEFALIFENMEIFQSQYLVDKQLSKYFNKIIMVYTKSIK